MSEGRSFEQVDLMTVHDLGMIAAYHATRPSMTDLIEAIAVRVGAITQRQPDRHVMRAPPANDSAPRAELMAAFAGLRFPAADRVASLG